MNNFLLYFPTTLYITLPAVIGSLWGGLGFVPSTKCRSTAIFQFRVLTENRKQTGWLRGFIKIIYKDVIKVSFLNVELQALLQTIFQQSSSFSDPKPLCTPPIRTMWLLGPTKQIHTGSLVNLTRPGSTLYYWYNFQWGVESTLYQNPHFWY